MRFMLFACWLLALGCKTTKTTEKPATTSWLDGYIAAVQQAPVTNPPIQITAYLFHQDTVYHVSAPCCDQFSTLYTATGKEICYPDGGITGKGDGRCPTFRSEANKLYVVWQDERNSEK